MHINDALFGLALIATAVGIYNTYRLRIVENARANIRYCIDNIKDRGCEITVNRTNEEAYGAGYSVSMFECEGALRIILDKFTEDITNDFVYRSTSELRTISMDGEQHFFLRLFMFLNEYATDQRFYGNDMMTFMCGIGNNKTRYSLTSFGKVFYKLYLASATYCVNKKIYTQVSLDSIKRSIDWGEVDVTKM